MKKKPRNLFAWGVLAVVLLCIVYLNFSRGEAKMTLDLKPTQTIAVRGQHDVTVARLVAKNDGDKDGVIVHMAWLADAGTDADNRFANCRLFRTTQTEKEFGPAYSFTAGLLEWDAILHIVVPSHGTTDIQLICDVTALDVKRPMYRFSLTEASFVNAGTSVSGDQLSDPEILHPLLPPPGGGTPISFASSVLIVPHGSLSVAKSDEANGEDSFAIEAKEEGFHIRKLIVDLANCGDYFQNRKSAAAIKITYRSFNDSMVTKTGFIPSGSESAAFTTDDFVVQEGFAAQQSVKVSTDDPDLLDRKKVLWDPEIQVTEAVGLISGDTITQP